MRILDHIPNGFIVFECLTVKEVPDDIELFSSGMRGKGKRPIDLNNFDGFSEQSLIFELIIKQMKVSDDYVDAKNKYQKGEYIFFISNDNKKMAIFMGINLPAQCSIKQDEPYPKIEDDYVSDYKDKKRQGISFIKTSLEKFISNTSLPSEQVEDFFKNSILIESLTMLKKFFDLAVKDENRLVLVSAIAVAAVEQILDNTPFNKCLERYSATVIKCDDKSATLLLIDDKSNCCFIKIPLIIKGIDYSAAIWIFQKSVGYEMIYIPSENCSLTKGFGTEVIADVIPKDLEFSFSKEEAVEVFSSIFENKSSPSQLNLSLSDINK
ncbi:MAG: hypothetical protein JXK16_00110 [Thiotrichales bacterium]|nr:hypothetical protein [Thiotrichales bacterium]